jgi:hypothetical protein
MPRRRSAGCLARTRDSCLRRTGYLGTGSSRPRRLQRVTASHPKALHDSVEQAWHIPAASGWNRKVAEYADGRGRVRADSMIASSRTCMSAMSALRSVRGIHLRVRITCGGLLH